MTTAIETAHGFYAALAAGDAPAALGLMADDVEWNTMWHYRVQGLGPQKVAEGLLQPLMAECAFFSLDPSEYISDGETIVVLGRLSGVHCTTGKTVDATFAHAWTVRCGQIQRFREFIDTCQSRQRSCCECVTIAMNSDISFKPSVKANHAPRGLRAAHMRNERMAVFERPSSRLSPFSCRGQ